MLDRFNEEDGMALIVSLMVAFVILMLSSVIVAQSIHSLNASGYDRQRLTSYNAAEAGVNAWWEDLQTTTLASLSCIDEGGGHEHRPERGPVLRQATFFAADATTTMTCPFTSANPPSFVRILSTGSSEGEAAREVEAFGQLTPVRTGFGAAIMAVNGTTFNNSFTVYGSSGNNGDIYILNGNLNISNSPTVYGNVYVPLGSATLGNNSEVKGDVWANGTVSVSNPSMVSGNAKSTAGNISGSGTVTGDATAVGTTTIGSVGGSRYPGTNPGPVPTQTFPQITNSTTAWTNAGYTLVGPFTGGVSLHERLQLHPQHREWDVGNERAHQHRGPDQCHVHVPERQQRHEHDPGQPRGDQRRRVHVQPDVQLERHVGSGQERVLHQWLHGGRLHRHEEHHRGQQHELRRVHERVLLHPVHREHEQHQQLRRSGARGERHDRQPVHDDVPAGTGAGPGNGDGVHPGHRVHPRGLTPTPFSRAAPSR